MSTHEVVHALLERVGTSYAAQAGITPADKGRGCFGYCGPGTL